jgi:hypothetical protein
MKVNYREYDDSNLNEVRRKSRKREIDEALDEELEALTEIDNFNSVENM